MSIRVLLPAVKKFVPDPARAVLLRLKRRLHPADRSAAIEGELKYWRSCLASGGGQYQQDFRERLDPDQAIQDPVASYIDQLDSNEISILDVGAGPLTSLGKRHHSKRITITATDVLANEYDRLFEDVGISPPVRTIYADAENLADTLGEDLYDIVHARNCIDHSSNPLRAIEQMLAVCKPQGFVLLYHAENEGYRNYYADMHQWNFTCRNKDFLIRNRWGRTTNVTRLLASQAEVECNRVPDDGFDMILTIILKKSRTPS